METPTNELTLPDVQRWSKARDEVAWRIGEHFARAEARYHASAYIEGLLSPVERKNSWQLAEMLGEATPYGLQHLLGRAVWEADALRDELQRYVSDYLGDREAVIVIDETGFLKKGRMSAGVARQYSGTAGRIENCQIGVFLTYASPRGHTLLDRALYVPQAWLEDVERCEQADIPAVQEFTTKPKLAKQMLERVLAAAVPVRWITGDSVYGDDRSLRLWLEAQEQAYVLAVSGKEYVWRGWQQQRISTLLKELPTAGWTRLSAGAGSKGPRLYDWLALPIGAALQEKGRRWVVVRRSISDPTDVTAYVAFAPCGMTLPELVRVAGTRWTVESDFEVAKGEVGLDQYEVRSWTGWQRHITLAMWAQALLSVIRATALETDLLKKRRRSRAA
ncbi:MAG: IS701 family transposase [Chthoniobacterales bacterium]|nr:IS701 family transposase [Chthoniobacterales bacterium]